MFLLAIFGWNDLQAEIIIYPLSPMVSTMLVIMMIILYSFVRQETKSG